MIFKKSLSHLLTTPIGSLSFCAQSHKGDLHNASISICEIEPTIPDGMQVEKCIGVLFKCISPKLLNNVVFSCRWNDLNAPGYGNSGEGLDAWEWEHDDILVMIGTEDGDWLNNRLNLGKQYLNDSYPVTMRDNQITINIENFEANKELSLHFVVAWNPAPEPVEASCWFAVDVPHKKLLAACN